MNTNFRNLLADAASLLRELPRDRREAGAARASFQQFRDSHASVRADLVIDRKPGAETVDYDILLGAPQGGTVVVSWQPDDGVPWTPQQADHWAANYVLTVNGRHTAIQSALLYLKTVLNKPVQGRKLDPMEELINGALTLEGIEATPLHLSEAEQRQAVNEYRMSLGLHSADATRQWLEETGLTVQGLSELAHSRFCARKLRDRVTAHQARPYFNTHRRGFDGLTIFRVRMKSDAAAGKFARAARKAGFSRAVEKLIPEEGRIESAYAHELSASFAAAQPNAIVGPEETPEGHSVSTVLRRKPARFDTRTRARIHDLLFREWLAEQRAKATIRWHWM